VKSENVMQAEILENTPRIFTTTTDFNFIATLLTTSGKEHIQLPMIWDVNLNTGEYYCEKRN